MEKLCGLRPDHPGHHHQSHQYRRVCWLEAQRAFIQVHAGQGYRQSPLRDRVFAERDHLQV